MKRLLLLACLSLCACPAPMPQPEPEPMQNDDAGVREVMDAGTRVATLATLTISLPGPRARVGDTVVLGITALDASGMVLMTPSLTWSVSDETVFLIDALGVGRPVKEGMVSISAAAGAVQSNVVMLEVLPNAAAGMFVVRFPDQRLTLRSGATRGLNVEVRDSAGNIHREVQLTFRAEGSARIVDGGVEALDAGTATVVARTPEGAEGRLPLSIVEGTQALQVEWVGAVATIAADRQVPLEWTVQMTDLLSSTGAGYPVVPDTLELFNGATKLQDVTLRADGGLPVLDVSMQLEGATLSLSFKATFMGQTAFSKAREVKVRHVRDTSWMAVGTQQVADDAWEHSLALDAMGNPWVAYRRSGEDILVAKLNPTTNRFERAAKSVNAPDRPTRPQLVAMDAGALQADGGWPVFQQEVDALNTHYFSSQYNYWPRLNATNPELRFDTQGRAIVVFGEQEQQTYDLGSTLSRFWDIRAKRIEMGATEWTFMGSALEPSPTDDCRKPAITLDPMTSAPVVAMACMDTIGGTFAIDVVSWNEAMRRWERFGARQMASMRQREVRAIAFESNDVLRVTTNEEGVAKTWRMTRAGMWTASAAAPVDDTALRGTNLAGAGTSSDGDLLGFTSSGSGWSRLGDLLDEQPLALAMDSSVALDAQGNPVVVWREGDPRSNMDLHVAKWNAQQLTWDRLGKRLDSAIDAMVLFSSIATNTGGTVFVSWSEQQANGQPRLRVIKK